MQFLREERGEKIYSLRGRTKNKKKKKSLHISHAHLPLPRNTTKKDGIRFTNQRRRGDKKEDRRPEEDHGQEGALVSLSRGSFSDRIPIFFFVSRPKWVSSSKGGEKTRPKNEPKKRNIRIFASMRIRPPKPPFRRRQTRASNAEMYREYIGARFDAAASVARRSRGRPFFRRLCVRKTKVERDLQSFFHRERSNAHPQLMGKKTRGRIERDFVFGPILIFFVASKSPKNTPKTDHIFFFFTQTLNNVLWVAPFVCFG